jgi:hypothetical protein
MYKKHPALQCQKKNIGEKKKNQQNLITSPHKAKITPRSMSLT